MSFLSETGKIPVFILNTATETDRITFLNSSIFTKTSHFFQLTPTSFQRVQIPKQIAAFSSLIVSHSDGVFHAIYPIDAGGVMYLKHVSFLKKVIDRAVTDQKANPRRRKSCTDKKSRLSMCSS